MDCVVHRVTKSHTRLSNVHFTSLHIPSRIIKENHAEAHYSNSVEIKEWENLKRGGGEGEAARVKKKKKRHTTFKRVIQR